MKRLILAAALIGTAASAQAQTSIVADCFRPGPISCEAMIINQLNQAKKQIRVSVYNWTLASTGDALIAAKQRGVDVAVVVDKITPMQKGEQPTAVAAAGIPIWVDCPEAIHHDKTAVIDGEILITGSFNWSTNAEKRNSENAIVIRDVPTAQAYLADWAAQQKRSEPFNPSNICGHAR